MVGFLVLLFLMIGIWYFLLSSGDTSEISKNWPKYRCDITIMPFASFYGHDATENFNFCMKNMMNVEAGPLLSPVFQVIATLLGTLASLISVANSIRLEFATFMGGVNTIFQNFTDRFKQLLFKIQMSAYRMKLLMGRLYATFYSLIYMSVAGIRGAQNFGDTILFQFLDTFCFDPDTKILVKGKGAIPVKEVIIGDIFEKTGSKVTSTFSFFADGQPMVELDGIIVSTNHFVKYDNIYVKAKDHPDAIAIGPWLGSIERPLICFNTSDHRIPIGNHIFMDYDETEEGDKDTMRWVDISLNGSFEGTDQTSYTTVFYPTLKIKLADSTYMSANEIPLGTKLSNGRVVGIVKKIISETCTLPSGEHVSPGNLVWNPDMNRWIRAGDLYSVDQLETPQVYHSFVVLNGASVETDKGTMLRDYVEVHSPEAEQFYAKSVASAERG